MGAEVLETISKDRREFARYFNYWKAVNDRESQLNSAHRKGIAQGMEQGIAKGMEQGIAQGFEQGFEQAKIETAVNMIKDLQLTVSKAMEITKLPEEKRSELIQKLERMQISYIA